MKLRLYIIPLFYLTFSLIPLQTVRASEEFELIIESPPTPAMPLPQLPTIFEDGLIDSTSVHPTREYTTRQRTREEAIMTCHKKGAEEVLHQLLQLNTSITIQDGSIDLLLEDRFILCLERARWLHTFISLKPSLTDNLEGALETGNKILTQMNHQISEIKMNSWVDYEIQKGQPHPDRLYFMRRSYFIAEGSDLSPSSTFAKHLRDQLPEPLNEFVERQLLTEVDPTCLRAQLIHSWKTHIAFKVETYFKLDVATKARNKSEKNKKLSHFPRWRN